MNKQAISDTLKEKHDIFINYLSGLSEEIFIKQHSGKWSPGQQLEHIYLSVKPVRQALSLPKFLLKFLWRKANRKSRNYDDLVARYLEKLSIGGKAPKRFIPADVKSERKQRLLELLSAEVRNLIRQIDNYTESELDKFVIPHPLLGKLTFREMLYFTVYHVEHHQLSITEISKS